MTEKRKQLSGSAKQYQQGKKVSQLWYTPEQYELVKAAAKQDSRSMVNFAIHATIDEAIKTLKTHGWTFRQGKLYPPDHREGVTISCPALTTWIVGRLSS